MCRNASRPFGSSVTFLFCRPHSAGEPHARQRRPHKDHGLRPLQRRHHRHCHHEDLLWNTGVPGSWGQRSLQCHELILCCQEITKSKTDVCLDPNRVLVVVWLCPVWWNEERRFVFDPLCLSVGRRAPTTRGRRGSSLRGSSSNEVLSSHQSRMSAADLTSSNVDLGGELESYFSVKRKWKRISNMSGSR